MLSVWLSGWFDGCPMRDETEGKERGRR